MSIATLSLQKNATGATITGGTAMSLSRDGVEVKNGVHVADMSEGNFIIRPNATFRTRVPVKQSDGTYSKEKRFCTIVVPKVLADGTVVYNLRRLEDETHPETTAAERLNLDMLAAQYYTDPDLADFRGYGSLA
jgi:hypothetical protein